MRRLLLLLLVPLAVAPAAAQAAPDAVPTAKVTGPIKSVEGNRPFYATEIDLASLGYVEEEFFLEGTARTYNGAEQTGTEPYKTRIMVRRPVDPKDFRGVVVAEWFNVTGQYDAEFDWFTSHEHFTRRGWTWVGVSAQYAGVQALKNFNQQRYGSLQVSDLASFDIYAQATKALRDGGREGADPLGGLEPQIVIADGHSQSSDKLSQYYNNQHESDGVVDAFFLRGFNKAIRTDLPTKAVRLLSENDVAPAMRALSGTDPTPDNDHYVRWEVAATSHVTYKEYRELEPLIYRDRGSNTPRQCAKPPYSRVPFHHAMNALYDHLVGWVRGGPAPPASPRMEFGADGVSLARDERGFVLGGIRLPDVTVPTALQTGENTGATFCVLYGSREPFTEQELLERYPSRDAYVTGLYAAIRETVDRGYMLREDVPALCRAAEQAKFGWAEPQPPVSATCPFAPDLGLPPTVPNGDRCDGVLRLELKAPRGERLRRAAIWVNGKRRTIVRGKALNRRVTLRGLPAGDVRVRIVARTRRGDTVSQTRRYRVCR